MGHFLQRREERQLPSLLTRLGRCRGPRHLLSALSFRQYAAQRRQPRALSQSGNRPLARSRPGHGRAGAKKNHLWPGAKASRRGSPIHSALVVEERRRPGAQCQRVRPLSRRRIYFIQKGLARLRPTDVVKRYLLQRLLLLLPTLLGA